jgi:hypothetical protein
VETTNHLVATSAVTGSSSCHGGSQGSRSWLNRRRGLVFGGGASAAGVALALSQQWLTVAELTPLLFLLPCAVMMLMCMKGMNHGQQTGGTQASAGTDTPIATDAPLR